MVRPLNSVQIGETVTVCGVEGCSPTLLSKLVSMGVVAGSTLTVTQRGLFGSPINVKVFGSVLSLRANEASLIRVAPAYNSNQVARAA